MSAFIVSRRHIEVLANALLAYGVVAIDETDADQEWKLGTLLWNENIESVSTRYRRDPLGHLPGPSVESFVYLEAKVEDVMEYMLQPWSILSLTRCFVYQSCEHDGWDGSQACAYTEALEQEVLKHLGLKDMEQARRRPEWDKAPWGIY